MPMPSLRVFNPEHDWSLAQGRVGGTPPRAAVCLANDLAFLPALMADDGDYVLVPDADLAHHGWQQWEPNNDVHFVETSQQLSELSIDGVVPWGWDARVIRLLLQQGINPALLPTHEQIDQIRLLSHRRQAQQVLSQLLNTIDSPLLVGESRECATMAEVQSIVACYGDAVVKVPWSSSGRGVMLCRSGQLTDRQQRRVANVLTEQGTVMCEPFYQCVCDLAMEFTAEVDGSITYDGLSIFSTTGAQYGGNLLATESCKEQWLARFIPLTLIEEVRMQLQHVLAAALCENYQGPLGVDMMVVEDKCITKDAKHWALHPCVEINLRCTMGHVALALERRMPHLLPAQMQIMHKGHFCLQLAEAMWEV